MAETTIEWTVTIRADGTKAPGYTFNPWVGCAKVSPACNNCYAESWAKRAGTPNLWQGERRRTSAANWRLPIKWNRDAAAAGERRKVFCASLADVFDNKASPEWRADLWSLIDQTPNLDWLLLTKRPQNIAKMLPDGQWRGSSGVDPLSVAPAWGTGYPNVWIGTTVENQEEADRRIPRLLAVPVAVRFLSCEPLLSGIDLSSWIGLGSQDGNQRSDDFSAYLDRRLVGGQRGPHLAPSRDDEGIGNRRSGDSLQTAPGGHRAIREGRLSKSAGDSWKDSLHGSGAQNSMDGCEPKSDPDRFGAKPQERHQDTEPSDESGIEYEAGKRDSRASCIGAIQNISARETYPRTSCQDPRTAEGQDPIEGSRGGRIRDFNGDGEEDRAARIMGMDTGIHWVIAGGESGPHARASHPDWFGSLRDQCAAARVAFHFKQWGEWFPIADLPSETQEDMELSGRAKFHDLYQMVRIGKKSAGRLLDGIEHNGFPAAQS